MSDFIDYVRLFLKSGKGGAGSVHFYRGKYIPKGGPDGGQGGRGGGVYVQANPNLNTLLHLKYSKHILAEDGQPGARQLRSGRDGEDAIVQVPIGTQIKHADSSALITELLLPDQRECLLSGGRGGLGNNAFKSSVHQAPRFAQPGEPGHEQWMVFELKLLADIGLIGKPNAGKSTLLSVISHAKPMIASYPFTTLTPQLGVVKYDLHHTLVVAEIPGLIEGASQNRGLGIRFLRHAERSRAYLMLVAADDPDLGSAYEMLRAELSAYNPSLLTKPHVVGLTKIDLLTEEEIQHCIAQLPAHVPCMPISSWTRQGIADLLGWCRRFGSGPLL